MAEADEHCLVGVELNRYSTGKIVLRCYAYTAKLGHAYSNISVMKAVDNLTFIKMEKNAQTKSQQESSQPEQSSVVQTSV